MEVVLANRLLNQLESHPALITDSPLLPQLPHLFILHKGQIHSTATIKGRFLYHIAINNNNQNKINTIFEEAVIASSIVNPSETILKLIDEYAVERATQSSFSKLSSPENHKLHDQLIQNLQSREENIHQFSFLGKLPPIDTIDIKTLTELFKTESPSTLAESYWNKFLITNPRFAHPDFFNNQILIIEAKERDKNIEKSITGKSIAASDRILEEWAKKFVQETAKLRPGEALFFRGTYGAKIDTFKTLYRFIETQHKDFTSWIPKFFKNPRFLEDPILYIKDQINLILKTYSENLPLELKKTLEFLAEDPFRDMSETIGRVKQAQLKMILTTFSPILAIFIQNGLIETIDKVSSNLWEIEILNLMRILSQMPGIDSFITTAVLFNLCGLAKLAPREGLLKALQWIGDHATGLTHPETKEETMEKLEEFIGSLIDEPIADFIDYVSRTFEQSLKAFHRHTLSPSIFELLYTVYPIDYPFIYAPYYIKIEAESCKNYTIYIYSSGHALNFHTHEAEKIQWPMRMSFVPLEELSKNFFHRLLLHRYRPQYDLEFTSRAEDLFGEQGLFSTITRLSSRQTPLDWRPYKQVFDTEWELLKTITTQNSCELASLYLHLHAFQDYLSRFRNNVNEILVPAQLEIITALKKALSICVSEFRKCKELLQNNELIRIKYTLSEIKEIISEAEYKLPQENVEPNLIPDHIVHWIKNAILACNISTEQIRNLQSTIAWILGSEAADAINLILTSADAASATKNQPVIDAAKKNAKKITISLKSPELIQKIKKFNHSPNGVYTLLKKLENDLIQSLKKVHHKIEKKIEYSPKCTRQNNVTQQLLKELRLLEKEVSLNYYGIRSKYILILKVIQEKIRSFDNNLYAFNESNIKKLEQITKRLDSIRRLRFELRRWEKHERQQVFFLQLNEKFDQLISQFHDIKIAVSLLEETKKKLCFLDHSIVTTHDIYRAIKEIQNLQVQLIKNKINIDLNEIHHFTKKRSKIDDDFVISRGYFTDFFRNFYMQTLYTFLNIVFIVQNINSPISWIRLYLNLANLLPSNWIEKIDYYLKKCVHFLAEKFFFALLKNLIAKGYSTPEEIERLFFYRNLVSSIASSLNQNREVSFKLKKRHFHNTITKKSLEPYLLAFSRFSLPKDIDCTHDGTKITSLYFKKFDLSFTIRTEGNKLKGYNINLFGNYAIAKNQDQQSFTKYGSYLLLENDLGEKKILISKASLLPLLSHLLLKDMRPIKGLIDNFICLEPILPYVKYPHVFFTYKINSDGQPFSNQPQAMIHLLLYETLSNDLDGAKRTSDRLTQIITSSSLHDPEIELNLWPICLPDFILRLFISEEKLLKLSAIRMSLFAALQKKCESEKPIHPKINFLITLALKNDLKNLLRKNQNLDGVPLQDREQQELMVYHSLISHLPGFREAISRYNPSYDPLLSITNYIIQNLKSALDPFIMSPEMGKRLSYLTNKYDPLTVSDKILHFLRDFMYANWFVPERSLLRCNAEDPPSTDEFRSSPSSLGIASLTEYEDVTPRLAKELYMAARTRFDILCDPRINWQKLSKGFNKYYSLEPTIEADSFNRTLLIHDFLTYYAIARGEYGDEKRINFRETLKVHKGGWDRTSRLLIEVLLCIASSPLECRLLPSWILSRSDLLHSFYTHTLFPHSKEVQNVLIKRKISSKPSEIISREVYCKYCSVIHELELTFLFKRVIKISLNAKTAYEVSKPIKRLSKWFLNGPVLGFFQARTVFLGWPYVPYFFIGTKFAEIFYNDFSTSYKEPPPVRANIQTLRSIIKEEFERLHNVIIPLQGANIQCLYLELSKHQNALSNSFFHSRKEILNLVNYPQFKLKNRERITYEQLQSSFLHGNFTAIANRCCLDPVILDLFMARLTTREAIANHLFLLVREYKILLTINQRLRSFRALQERICDYKLRKLLNSGLPISNQLIRNLLHKHIIISTTTI